VALIIYFNGVIPLQLCGFRSRRQCDKFCDWWWICFTPNRWI